MQRMTTTAAKEEATLLFEVATLFHVAAEYRYEYMYENGVWCILLVFNETRI